VRAALAASRMVTLTGTAGTGKTRLAIEVGSQIDRDKGAEVWFVDLAPVRDARLVDRAVLAVLGEREERGRTAAQTVAAHLEGHQALLLVDNCEHVVESCAAVALDLLKLAPGVRLLATSRTPLAIPGEIRWPVPQLSDEEAVDLFVQRARMVVPGFALTSESFAAVTELCRRLDGLPLAIELATARLGQLPLGEVLARLDQRLALLVDRGRGVAERHRTLSAALDWSYELLDPEERRQFDRLSVFAGGFSIRAAEEVARADLEVLSTLVDESLLTSTQGLRGRARFRLLESVREYAAERLRTGPGAETTLRAHFGYFSGFAAAAEAELRGPDQVWWLDQLEEEHDNLRAALDWGLRYDPEAAITMAAGIAWFWNVHGHFSESVRRLHELMAAAPNADIRLRAIGLAALGRLAVNLPDSPGAEAALDESIALWRRIDAPKGLAHALMSRALLSILMRDSREACDRLIEGALLAAEKSGDWHHRAEAVAYLGVTAFRLAGDVSGGLRWTKEAVGLAREHGDLWILAFAIHFQGAMELDLGDVASSEASLTEALALWEALQDPEWLATTNSLLGAVALASDDLVEARHRLQAALTSKRFLILTDFPPGGPLAVHAMAKLAASKGQYERASRLEGAALTLPTITGQSAAGLEQQDWYPTAVRLLGATHVRAAWDEGQRMTHPQAIAYALAEMDDSLTRGGPLTPRERQIVALVGFGLRNREIAEKLFISERTVDGHLEHIREKLGVHTRSEVAVWATTQGLVR